MSIKRGFHFMTTSWVVTGLGIVVSLIGWYLTPNDWGYGILGFGLAHIVLGILDMFRDPARNQTS
jgi:hypothetical protein